MPLNPINILYSMSDCKREDTSQGPKASRGRVVNSFPYYIPLAILPSPYLLLGGYETSIQPQWEKLLNLGILRTSNDPSSHLSICLLTLYRKSACKLYANDNNYSGRSVKILDNKHTLQK